MNIQRILALDIARKLAQACKAQERPRRIEVHSFKDLLEHDKFFEYLARELEDITLVRLDEPPFEDGNSRYAAVALELLSKLDGKIRQDHGAASRPRWPLSLLWPRPARKNRERLHREIWTSLSRCRWTPLTSQALIELLRQVGRSKSGAPSVLVMLDSEVHQELRDFVAWHLRDTHSVLVQFKAGPSVEQPADRLSETGDFEIRSSWAIVADTDVEKVSLLAAARNTAAWIGLFELVARTGHCGNESTHDADGVIDDSFSNRNVVPRKLLNRGVHALEGTQKLYPERWLMMDLVREVDAGFYQRLKSDPIQGPIDLFDWTRRQGKDRSFSATVEDALDLMNPANTSASGNPPMLGSGSPFDLFIRSRADAAAFLDAYFRRGTERIVKNLESVLSEWIQQTARIRKKGSRLFLESLDAVSDPILQRLNELIKYHEIPNTVNSIWHSLLYLQRLRGTFAMDQPTGRRIDELAMKWLRSFYDAQPEGTPSIKDGIELQIKVLLATFYGEARRIGDGSLRKDLADYLARLKDDQGRLRGEGEGEGEGEGGYSYGADALEGLTQCIIRANVLVHETSLDQDALRGALLADLAGHIHGRGQDTITLMARLTALLWALILSPRDKTAQLCTGLRLAAWVDQLLEQRGKAETPASYRSPLVFISYRRDENRNSANPDYSPLINDLLSKDPGIHDRIIVDRKEEGKDVPDWNENVFRLLFLSDAQICFVDDSFYESPWCLLELLVGVLRQRLEYGKFDFAIVHLKHRIVPIHPVPASEPEAPTPASQSGAAASGHGKQWEKLREALRDEVDRRTTTSGHIGIDDTGAFDPDHIQNAIALIEDFISRAAVRHQRIAPRD